MRKVLKYEQHAAECRQLAAEMKNLQPDVWDRLARQRRQGIVENKHDQA